MIDMISLCEMFADVVEAAYSNGSITIEPVVLRPPMNVCAAAASRSGKVLTTLLATTPSATASNSDLAAIDFASVRHVM